MRARPERILVVPYLLFGGRPVARLGEQIRDFENRFPWGSRLNPDARCSVDFATIRLGRDRLAIFIATLGWSRICSVMIGPLVRDGRKGLAYNQSPEQPRNIRRSRLLSFGGSTKPVPGPELGHGADIYRRLVAGSH